MLHPLFERHLPPGWQLTTVDDIKATEPSSCVAGPFGSNISSKYFVEEGVPVIRGCNLRDDLTQFVPEGFAFVSTERALAYKAQHVRAGDLVFTCWGTIGQVGLIPKNGPYPEYIISNKQLKLRPSAALADPRFLFYYFASPQMVAHIRSRAIGAAVPGINLGILKKLPVALPPLHVQNRTADILSAYDDLIENNTKRIKILEGMARSLYREWFVNFRFPGHEKVKLVNSLGGKVPEGWTAGTLGDVVTLQRGFDLPERERRSGAVPIVSSSGITGTHETAKIDPPGIVTGRYGTLGEVYLIREPFWPLNTTLFVKDFKGNNHYWLLYLLRSMDFSRQNAAGAVPGINRNALHLLDVHIAPRELQARFGSLIDPLLRQVEVMQRRNKVLAGERDLLLPRLISGEIDVSRLEAPGA